MPAPGKYPDELRERAVREVRTSGRPVAHVAKDLGIRKEALRGWVREAEVDKGDRPHLLGVVTLRCSGSGASADARRASGVFSGAAVTAPPAG
ncbi:transposase [Streptomyces tauricus]|uniref:transposase n=1 Tax=Streptomyces tauricus TaxID=68274 RepID=UPI0038B611EA